MLETISPISRLIGFLVVACLSASGWTIGIRSISDSQTIALAIRVLVGFKGECGWGGISYPRFAVARTRARTKRLNIDDAGNVCVLSRPGSYCGFSVGATL